MWLEIKSMIQIEVGNNGQIYLTYFVSFFKINVSTHRSSRLGVLKKTCSENMQHI